MPDYNPDILYLEVEQETARARGLFLNSGIHFEQDKPSRFLMLAAIQEELGKATRAVNKLALLPQDSVNPTTKMWLKEVHEKNVAAMSLIRRFDELYPDLPRR